MAEVTIRDVTDESTFRTLPPCADSSFDHRTCDYWEDEGRGSKAARPSWLEAVPRPSEPPPPVVNPFAPTGGPTFNPFDPRSGSGRPSGPARNPFADEDEAPLDNPFARRREAPPGPGVAAPRKLQLLARGLAVVGSYAKVLEVDGRPAAYCQFGPLSAYPRAQRLRDLYPQLPASPLPAVITCIATTRERRGEGLARRLVQAVVDDLASRGFAAVEAYPEPHARADATSGASPDFWLACGFSLAVDDPRYPVLRREL
jgi:GNAT superfamily N-acetyltransferase